MTVPDGDGSISSVSVFPQFPLLPAEFQGRVWYHFCAITAAEPRVLDFEVRSVEGLWWKVIPGRYLIARTRPVNVALVVNQSCRRFALRAFPNTLSVCDNEVKGLVRFNKAKYIIAARIRFLYQSLTDNCNLEEVDRVGPFVIRKAYWIIPGFSDNVERLAVDGVEINSKRLIISIEGDDTLCHTYLWNFVGTFRNLKVLYCLLDHRSHALRNILWCGSTDVVNTYRTTGLARVAYGKTRKISVTTVWPNTNIHLKLPSSQVQPPIKPLVRIVKEHDKWRRIDKHFFKLCKGIWLLPMIQFDGKKSQRVLEKLKFIFRHNHLPDEKAPGLQEPSCVATVDCDNTSGPCSHSADGAHDVKQQGEEPGERRDWITLCDEMTKPYSETDTINSDDLTWATFRHRSDPFDIHWSGIRFPRDSTTSTLRTDCEGLGILKGFSPNIKIEQWLEGIGKD